MIKKKTKQKPKANKYLFTDNSFLSWGQNDNHNSINSKLWQMSF